MKLKLKHPSFVRATPFQNNQHTLFHCEVTPMASPVMPWMSVFLFKLILHPTALSGPTVLTPIVSRNHPGVQADTHTLTMNIEPKELSAAHGRPHAPRFPKARESAVLPPMSAVSAAISTRPPLMLNIVGECREVLAIRRAGGLTVLYSRLSTHSRGLNTALRGGCVTRSGRLIRLRFVGFQNSGAIDSRLDNRSAFRHSRALQFLAYLSFGTRYT